MKALLVAILLGGVIFPPCADETVATPAYTVEELHARMKKAVTFLLDHQNPDGSWGGFRNMAVGYDEFWTNIETHRSWTVATTGLCCMALLDVADLGVEGMEKAYDRGVRHLIENAELKRPSDWDVDNNWGNCYGLQALVCALRHTDPNDEALRKKISVAIETFIKSLAEYQTLSHGWAYYDDEPVTQRPQWGTSFMTAVAVLALLDARDAGFEVDDRMISLAVRAIERCRLPSGAFTYSIEAVPSPGGIDNIDQIKGSLCRIPVCNLALLRAGREIKPSVFITGLEHFFGEHRFLDIARKKPNPHEAYYYNSGYFYFFGHYYTALVIEELAEDDQQRWRNKLRHEILKTQEEDGSMWDYYMSSYGKPYGVAYSLMALAR